MSNGKEPDLVEVTKLPPFMLVGSLMCALAGAAVACALGARTPTAMGAGVFSVGLFVGLTLDGFLQHSRTEARWALGLTVILWIVVCGAFAQFAGLAIFAGAGMIGVGVYLIKRQRRNRKDGQDVETQ